MAAERSSAATLDSSQHTEMLPTQPGSIFLDKACARRTNDIGHLEKVADSSLMCKTLNLTSQTAKQVECFGQRKTPFALLYFSILHWPEPVKAGTSAPARP
jgi:hypothetical protein